jgi:ribosomal protein L37AE/L43A
VSERVIEAEVVQERIVACPQCGRRNRLYKRTAAGVYKCGACRAALSNPSVAAKAAPSMRTMGIAAAAIIVLLVIIVIGGGNSSSPSPSVSSEAMPKSSYYASTPAPLPQTIPTLTAFTPLPGYSIQPAATPPPEIPTEVPRSGILFDAYPGSTADGQFIVINGSSRHAIAKVIDIGSDRKILSFAIHAGKRTKITAIPDGTYNVIFAFGDRVYLGTDRFEKPRGFSKFDRPFAFNTRTTATETEEGILYRTSATALEVTLTAVIGGNITTSSISQQEFERY